MVANGIAKKLTALAASLAILLAVPASAAPSFTVFADEEIQETEATKAKETVKETVKETKAPAKASESVKETEKPKASETTKATDAAKPSETSKETEQTKPAETTKATEPSSTSKQTEETKETTAPSETKQTEESAKPTEPSESSETAAPSETSAEPAETTEPTESTEPAESTEPTESTEPSEAAGPAESTKPTVASRRAAKGTYNGIKIDGNFSDWDSVVKHDFSKSENSYVNNGAIVWDGEWIYLYIDEFQQNSSSWSGPNKAGNFVIQTDTGLDVVVTLKNNGSAGNKVKVVNKKTGVELTSDNGGVKVAVNNEYSEWGKPSLLEIAIPTSILPDYKRTISFGYYLGDLIVKDVANLHPEQVPDDPDNPGGGHDSSDNDGSKIKIDGDYKDWKNYPHQVIEYDTNGASHTYSDAEGAIYQKNAKTVYVHAYTNDFDPPFAWYDGNQFLEITVSLNGRKTKMMACLVDDNGNVNWHSSEQDKHYKPGTYKFALFEPTGWHQTTNMNNISQGDIFYGYQYLTVGTHVDETEFSIDTEALAKKLGLSLSSAGELKVYFHRVGKEPLVASGISTGPVFTLALTSVAAGSYYVFTRRKRRQA